MRARETGRFPATARGERIDWQAARDSVDLDELATRLLGPAPGRRGERSARRLWWGCPFHQDSNPSFCVKPGGRYWRCWGCGAKGDVIELVRRLNPAWTFPEAVAYATGRPVPSGSYSKLSKSSKPPAAVPTRASMPTARPPVRSAERPLDGPKRLQPADALALVEEAAERLWTPEGRAALAYLKGRGLTGGIIKAAGLGWTPRADGVPWKPPGVVIPWSDGGRLALVKIRPPGEWRERFPEDRRPPKYIEAFRDRPALYPGPEAIRPGAPLVIVEGELDALLMAQELGYLASVITTGSSSTRLDPSVLPALLRCPRWFAAHDADDAGDGAAAEWPSRAVRCRPPEPCKDWGEVHASGFNRIRYLWGGILRRPGTPWDELAPRRWGTGLTDPAPGIVADRAARGG